MLLITEAISVVLLERGWIAAALGVPATILAGMLDRRRTRVTVSFDQQALPPAFQEIVSSAQVLQRSQRLSLIIQSQTVHDPHQRKVNAGASQLHRSSDGRVDLAGPRALVADIPVPTLRSGRLQVHFFPDAVLLFQDGHSVSLPYGSLHATFTRTQTIEDERVPSDAQIIEAFPT